MPIYEYVCNTCSHRFEKLRPMSRMDDDAPVPDLRGRLGTGLCLCSRLLPPMTVERSGSIAGAGGCGGCGPGGCALLDRRPER